MIFIIFGVHNRLRKPSRRAFVVYNRFGFVHNPRIIDRPINTPSTGSVGVDPLANGWNDLPVPVVAQSEFDIMAIQPVDQPDSFVAQIDFFDHRAFDIIPGFNLPGGGNPET